MRNKFDQQLNTLHMEIRTMGALCENAISLSVKALLENDSELIREVIEADSRIDAMEREIETLCMRMLLQQQPVAKDLRVISSALKMISDMERIGDQAADIAEITATIGERGRGIIESGHIGEMARATIKMVTESVEAYVNADEKLAAEVFQLDDIVDNLFDNVKAELVKNISAEKGEAGLDLLLVAKYLERIGDHAENIAGWAQYSITGVHSLEESQQHNKKGGTDK